MVGRPFQIDLDEARDMVRPEPLEDVLKTLSREGVLARFEIGQHFLFVWPSCRIDAAAFFQSFDPRVRVMRAAQRRPSSLKKGRR